MNKQLKIDFKLLFLPVLLLPIFLSCNNSINKNKPASPTMNSKKSMAVIDTVIFNHYDERTKQFIASRETQLKYNSQGGTIEANYYKYYAFSKEKNLWSNHQAKYSGKMLIEFTSELGSDIRKTKYKFDAEGKVLSTIYLDKKDGSFIPTSREIFEWENNLLASQKACSSMENECNESFERKHEYDSKGRKISTFSTPNGEKDTVRYFYNDFSSIPVKVTKIPYEYDLLTENGKVIEIKKSYYDQYTQKMALEKKTMIKYDKKDRVILIQEKTDHETEDSKYIYDELGNLAELKYSSRSRLGLDQTKWVFGVYTEYPNFATPAWFAETGYFWFEPKFILNKFIDQYSFENVKAKVIASKSSFPSGYIEYCSKGQVRDKDKFKDHWVPYQKVEYKVTEFQ